MLGKRESLTESGAGTPICQSRRGERKNENQFTSYPRKSCRKAQNPSMHRFKTQRRPGISTFPLAWTTWYSYLVHCHTGTTLSLGCMYLSDMTPHSIHTGSTQHWRVFLVGYVPSIDLKSSPTFKYCQATQNGTFMRSRASSSSSLTLKVNTCWTPFIMLI